MSSKDITIARHVGRSLDGMMLDDKNYKLSNEPLANPELIVGLELEIEGWVGRSRDYTGFNFDTDGSLRNHGIEAISLPTKSKFVQALLEGFYKDNVVTKDNYSERCSTHVHVNVLNFNLDQLASVAMLYQVFERLIFNFIGDDRDKNIFCVPWYQANINTNLVDVIRTGKWRNLQRWSKYTAMNLLAVTNRGTVEYRHLGGTCDVERIMAWVNILGCLHDYASKNSVEDIEKIVANLNTSSAYDVFLQSVFGPWSKYLKTGDFQIAMENGVIDAKIMLTKDTGLLEEVPVDAFEQDHQPAAQAPRPWAGGMQFVNNPINWNEIRGDNPLRQQVILDDLDVPQGNDWINQHLEEVRQRQQVVAVRAVNPPGNPIPRPAIPRGRGQNRF